MQQFVEVFYAAKQSVTTATADGVLVNQTETKSTDGKVTVDMTGAKYFYSNKRM